MTRLYYDDPLAAMWMAKHFRMTFDNGGTVALDCPGDIDLARHLGSERFIIHPDSLPLLEPKVGDLVSAWYGWHGVVSDLERDGAIDLGGQDVGIGMVTKRHPLRAHSANGYVPAWGKIIQRYGKPFHWPLTDNQP